ncbi:MAG: hypothetical protein RR224_04950 [Clostridia bacterium]
MLIFAIAMFILGGAVELGYNLFVLQGHPAITNLFEWFRIFDCALGLRVLMTLKILCWTLPFCCLGNHCALTICNGARSHG